MNQTVGKQMAVEWRAAMASRKKETVLVLVLITVTVTVIALVEQ